MNLVILSPSKNPRTMEHKIKAETRSIVGKKVKKIRNAGYIPGAVYGFKGLFNLQISTKEFTKLYDDVGTTAVVEVDIAGKNHNCYIGEVQMDPVSREYMHVSFREVNLNVETTSTVPFVLHGQDESPAVKEEESMIILSMDEIELRGLPKNLPEEIELNVSGFHAGDTITVEEIKLPEGVELVHDEKEDRQRVVVTTASAVQDEEEIDVQAATEELQAQEDEAAENTKEGAGAGDDTGAQEAKDKKE